MFETVNILTLLKIKFQNIYLDERMKEIEKKNYASA